MSIEENLELIHRMYDALNAQDLEAHDKFWSKDMIWHGPPGFGDIHGLEAFKYEVLQPFYTAFPDYHASNDIELTQGEWIAATGFVTGTHQGEWLGVAPTGKPMKMRFSDFWRVKHGLLVENWVMVDHIDVMRQLGIDLPAQTKLSASYSGTLHFPVDEAFSMSAAQNLELMHRMVDALNAQDLEAHDEFWSQDMVWHGPPGFGDIHGLEAFKNDVLRPFYAAFPDFHGTIDIELAQGNWIAATGFVTGTHRGEWLGVPPTGKPVKMRYSDFWLVKDGLLVENWVMVDDIDVMRQLGIDLLARKGEG